MSEWVTLDCGCQEQEEDGVTLERPCTLHGPIWEFAHLHWGGGHEECCDSHHLQRAIESWGADAVQAAINEFRIKRGDHMADVAQRAFDYAVANR